MSENTFQRAAHVLCCGDLAGAGLDGLAVDLRTVAACGARATVVAASIQGDTTGEEWLRGQWASAALLPIDAIKLGHLATEVCVRAVGELTATSGATRVVLDVSCADRNGAARVSPAALAALPRWLFGHATVVCANVHEAELLTGKTVRSPGGMRDAARRMFDSGSTWTLVMGGRLPGHPIDIVYDGKDFTELGGDRIGPGRLAGTGATFTAALATGLARGLRFLDAAERARRLVDRALSRALVVGHGRRALEPLAGLFDGLGEAILPVSEPLPEDDLDAAARAPHG